MLRYKRLHRALFRLPTTAAGEGPAIQLDATALAQLLAGVAKQKSARHQQAKA